MISHGVKALTLLFALMLVPLMAFAQFTDLPQDESTVNLAVGGDSESRTVGITALHTINAVNGWAGVHVLRTSTKGEVVSEVAKARLQGGGDILGIGLEGFVDGERNIIKNLDWTTQVGYFARLATYKRDILTLSLGAGNFVENHQTELDLDESATVVRWLGFGSGEYGNLSWLAKYTPQADNLSDYVVTVDSGLGFDVLGVTATLNGKIEYKSHPIGDAPNLYGHYLAGVQFKF